MTFFSFTRLRFLFGLLSLGLLLNAAQAATDATVTVNGALSQVSVSPDVQTLATIDIKNTTSHSFDMRRLVLSNQGDLSLKAALTDVQLIKKGDVASLRGVFYEDWDIETSELKDSLIEFWIDPLVLDAGEVASFDLRATVTGLEESKTFLPSVESISVKMGGADFIRDLELEVESAKIEMIAAASGGTYAPVIKSAEEEVALSDLIVEKVRFEREYGYSNNVFVIPVCNKGIGTTPVDSRIEGSVYANNTIRDFIFRRQLEPGKCIEHVLSAKRDLGINEAGEHKLRVEVDLQNSISEIREYNNARFEVVFIADDVVLDTNTQKVNNLSPEARDVVRRNTRPRRPRVARGKTYANTRIRGRSTRGTSEALERYKASLAARKEAARRFTMKNEDGELQTTTQAGEIKKEFLNIKENGILRDELPKTEEQIWEEQAWERSPLQERNSFRKKGRQVAPPNQLEQKVKRPTFREPNVILRPRTSYRGLRSGIRSTPDYRGQRSNNIPELTTNTYEAFCKDSDGLNFFERGTVEYKSSRMITGRTAQDVTRGPYVLEYYCEGDYMRRKLFECEEVGDGMCVK